ncbi:hypothetical protein KQX54_000696 [Cotesia glomerata]|uniref:Uncharacterized protein n=1 Tax=Cotesia glomerata TaxID=32391 RepID=A0AAV7I605_COTGL|nr:hypothetical protein KQX54_000696 [Cotesia glomerata]
MKRSREIHVAGLCFRYNCGETNHFAWTGPESPSLINAETLYRHQSVGIQVSCLGRCFLLGPLCWSTTSGVVISSKGKRSSAIVDTGAKTMAFGSFAAEIMGL